MYPFIIFVNEYFPDSQSTPRVCRNGSERRTYHHSLEKSLGGRRSIHSIDHNYAMAAKKIIEEQSSGSGQAMLPSRHIYSKSAKPALPSALVASLSKRSNISFTTARTLRPQDEIHGSHRIRKTLGLASQAGLD